MKSGFKPFHYIVNEILKTCDTEHSHPLHDAILFFVDSLSTQIDLHAQSRLHILLDEVPHKIDNGQLHHGGGNGPSNCRLQKSSDFQ